MGDGHSWGSSETCVAWSPVIHFPQTSITDPQNRRKGSGPVK